MLSKIRHKALFTASVIVVLGIVYYFVVVYTPFSIPCMFRKITGLACPGCGITALCVKLIRLDVISAVKENVGVTAVAVSFAVWYVVKTIFRPKCMEKNSTFEKAFLIGCIVFLIAFGIVRNLKGMEFLLPSAMK